MEFRQGAQIEVIRRTYSSRATGQKAADRAGKTVDRLQDVVDIRAAVQNLQATADLRKEVLRQVIHLNRKGRVRLQVHQHQATEVVKAEVVTAGAVIQEDHDDND
jgi:hypothetical protein